LRTKSDLEIRLNRLEVSPFFSEFTNMEKSELAKDSMAFETFPAESFICHEGRIDQVVYIILSGAVQVSKKTPSGETGIIKLKTGSIIGELSLLRKGKRVSSVQALEKTIVYKLTPFQLKTMNVHLQVKIKGQILKLVIRRYEVLCEKYSELVKNVSL